MCPSVALLSKELSGEGVADESMYAVQIVGLKSDGVQFHSFQAANAVENPMEAGEELGRQVAGVTQSGNRVLFLFPDFRTNITSLFGVSRSIAIYRSSVAHLVTT